MSNPTLAHPNHHPTAIPVVEPRLKLGSTDDEPPELFLVSLANDHPEREPSSCYSLLSFLRFVVTLVFLAF